MIRVQVRPGAYYDSVVLMQLQRGLVALPGVQDAGVVMGTPANKEVLAQSDLLVPAADAAGADDLVIAVRADDAPAADAALAQVDALLARKASHTTDFRPRSLETAAAMAPDARWLLVSVPGRFAAGVARQGLDLGRHVFLYSDNVSLEDEIALKRAAADSRLFERDARAVVFSSLEDLSARIDDPSLDVTADDILVLQNAGPKGAPGMPEAGYVPIPKKLAAKGVKDMVRISDARMSGTAFGTIVLHITPESAAGGPLGLVRNGDRIRVAILSVQRSTRGGPP